MSERLVIEPLDESGGHCDCCGNTSKKIWGLIHSGDLTVAAYWLHWTVGHLDAPGANLDLVIGSWGEGTSTKDRFAASLVYREPADSPPAFMVIDATERQMLNNDLAGFALRREEVIGTPVADQIFRLVDAIWLQDDRIF